MSTAIEQSGQPKKSVLDYERYVYALKELSALVYFMCTSSELDELAHDAIAGIHNQLDITSLKIEELFELAADLQRELNQLKRGK